MEEIAELKEQAEEALRVLGGEYSSKVYDIERYIEELEAAQPRWYSIKKGEVPEDGEPVQVWGKRGYAIACRERDEDSRYWVECTTPPGFSNDTLEHISHWTPVLEKPKEEE